MKNEIVIFTSEDGQVSLDVQMEDETVWLSQAQMVNLFQTTKQNISLHINNCFKEGELDREAVVKESLTTASDGKNYKTKIYNLDVIISVGYRVKSKRGVEFRRWANSVLKQYILQGYAVNNNRINQLGEVIRIMKRTENALDSKQVLTVIEKYNEALEMLDSYDHQTMKRPKGNESAYELTYEECRQVIADMRFGDESDLFGKEKDAHLLYFVTKNHSFYDGNKRIAATMFLYFLDKNGVLFVDGKKIIRWWH